MTEENSEISDAEFETQAAGILREIEEGSARFAKQTTSIREGLNKEIRAADEALQDFANEVAKEEPDGE